MSWILLVQVLKFRSTFTFCGLPADAKASAFADGWLNGTYNQSVKFFYTYVLKSLKDGKFYTGWTDNLKQRVLKHNRGLVEATKVRRPLKLVYFEACLSKEVAVRREKTLKTGFGRKYLKERITDPR